MFTSDAALVFLAGLLLGLLAGMLLAGGLFYFYLQSSRKKEQELSNSLLAQAKLRFEAISAQALRNNTDHFFTIARETLSSQVEHGEQDLESKKQLIDQTLAAMRAELNGVSELVTKLEKDRESKFGELTQQLKTAAEQTGKLQETTEHLRIALSNTKTRGQWGERMAEDVLRAAGFVEGVNFLKQETLLETNNRPDYTFLLPRGRKVHMDVKFPLDNYIRFLDADSDDLRLQYRSRFIQDVRSRIKEVTRRDYIDPADDTISYMIVFIPNEQLFSFVCQEDAAILDTALHSKVILCSPMTLFAILAVIRQAIDNFYLEEKTLRVLKVLDAFNKQWIAYANSFDGLGKKIDAVQSEYLNLTTRRRNQVDRQLAKIGELREGQGDQVEIDFEETVNQQIDEGGG
jgi:DNA recombination protein RmuC